MSIEHGATIIKVGRFSVGIVNSKAALEEAAQKELSSNEEIDEHLVGLVLDRKIVLTLGIPIG